MIEETDNDSAHDEEDVDEPKITSLDPNERKFARRLRIQRRLEQVRKQQLQEGDIEEEEEEKTLLDQQLLKSKQRLETLLLEGQEQVTNVRVANDAREVRRREEYIAAREKRLERLEMEADESMRKFDVISNKWDEISRSNDPLNIHYEMELQKAKCLDLIEQKDKLIEELRFELKRADDRFNRDLRKQTEDIAILVERIEKQVEVMQSAYRQELILIEEAINMEHQQILESNERKWDALFKEREKEEVTNASKKFKQVATYEEDMKSLKIEHYEKFRESKIQLESDMQVLQQELEKLKALCLLNSEKLDYNFQVLKKRDDENIIMKAQQKRRINKLQDVVNSLKGKIAKIEKTTKIDTRRLTDEVVRLHHNITEIERKADHFAMINENKYQQVWEMNNQEAQELVEKILSIDRIIHVTQLRVPWVPPDRSLLNKTDLVSYQSAMQVVAELYKNKDAENKEEYRKSREALTVKSTESDLEVIRAEGRLMRHILQKIADSSGFLIEDRLRVLLYPYSKHEKTLVKIDNVFCALGVSTEEDMLMLKEYFMPYAVCSVCKTPRNVEEVEEETAAINLTDLNGEDKTLETTEKDAEDHAAGDKESRRKTRLEEACSEVFNTMCQKASDDDNDDVDDEKKKLREVDSKKLKFSIKEFSPKKRACHPSHILTIDPIYVLQALREFITVFSQKKEIVMVNLSTRLAQKRSTVSRLLNVEDVTTFWTRFRQIFSPQREKLWDAFYLGLQQYQRILEERHRVNLQTQFLRKQNTELRRLLHKYMLNTDKAKGCQLPARDRIPSIKYYSVSERNQLNAVLEVTKTSRRKCL